jgi:hypothetical protein
LQGNGGDTHAGDDATADMAGHIDKRKLRNLSGQLVVLLLNMVRDEQDRLKALQAAGKVDELFTQVLKMQFSSRQLSKLTNMMMED